MKLNLLKNKNKTVCFPSDLNSLKMCYIIRISGRTDCSKPSNVNHAQGRVYQGIFFYSILLLDKTG